MINKVLLFFHNFVNQHTLDHLPDATRSKRKTYRGRGKGKARKLVDGYVVKWSDGKWENWPYESLVPCLVPLPHNFELGAQNLKEIEKKQDVNKEKEAGEVEVSELMNMSIFCYVYECDLTIHTS